MKGGNRMSVRVYTDIIECYIENNKYGSLGWIPVAPLPNIDFGSKVTMVALKYFDYMNNEAISGGTEELSMERVKSKNLTSYAFIVYSDRFEVGRISFICAKRDYDVVLNMFKRQYMRYPNVSFKGIVCESVYTSMNDSINLAIRNSCSSSRKVRIYTEVAEYYVENKSRRSHGWIAPHNINALRPGDEITALSLTYREFVDNNMVSVGEEDLTVDVLKTSNIIKYIYSVCDGDREIDRISFVCHKEDFGAALKMYKAPYQKYMSVTFRPLRKTNIARHIGKTLAGIE